MTEFSAEIQGKIPMLCNERLSFERCERGTFFCACACYTVSNEKRKILWGSPKKVVGIEKQLIRFVIATPRCRTCNSNPKSECYTMIQLSFQCYLRNTLNDARVD